MTAGTEIQDTAPETADEAKTRVFLSYSRKDSALVAQIADGLQAAGFLADFDKAAHDPNNVSAGIAAEDEWWKRLQEMIAAADVMVFLVSPDSATSAVCDEEIAYARALGKRIIAVLARPVDFARAPPRLSALNVRIDFSEAGPGLAPAMELLCRALEMNVGWHREGRKYHARVQEWDVAGRPKSRLLREGAVEDAERWALARPRNEPEPGELFLAWIAASRAQIKRDAAVRAFWRRVTAVFVLTTLVATLAGAWFVVSGQRNLGRSESLMLARTADQFYNKGDMVHALQLATLAARDSFLSPSTDEAKAAFARSAQALNHRITVRQEQPGGGPGDSIISSLWVNAERDRMVTTNYMNLTFIWDMATGAQIGETLVLAGDNDRQHLEVPETGRHVVAWDYQGAHILSLEDGAKVGGTIGFEAGDSGELQAVSLSADGRRVATGVRAGKVRVYDTATGKKLTEFPARGEGLPDVRMSADGSKVLVVYTGRAFLADAATGAILSGPFDPGAGLYTGGFLSPDGSRAVLPKGQDGMEIWNTETGERIAQVQEDGSDIERVEFMTSMPRIVTVTGTGIVTIYDSESGAQTGKPIATEAWFGSVDIRPGDTTFLARTYLAGPQLWDIGTGEGLLDVDEDNPQWVNLIQNRARQTFMAWDGTQISEVFVSYGRIDPQPVVFDHPGYIDQVVVSPDGRLAISVNEAQEARLWDLATNALLGGPYLHSNAIVQPVFLDAQTFVTIGNETATVWSVPNARPVAYTGDADLGDYLMGKVSPDGSRLLLWNEAGRAVLQDTATGARVGREMLLGDAGDWGAVFDPASPLMMIWFEGVVQLVDTDTGEVRDGFLEHALPVRDAAFALGGSRLVTHSGASVITVWNTETMEKVREFDPGTELYEMPLIEPVRGRMMIANGTDARLYDLGAGAALGEPIVMPWAKSGDSEEDYQGIPLLGRFSPDGTQLAIYTSYHIGLWSAEDGRALGAVTEPGFEMYSVRFVPGDGEVALLGDRDVRFMNLRSGAVSDKVLEHRNFAGDLVASPDGRQLATVAEDRMIRFWDAETGKMLGSPIPVAIMEQDLIYSDDGRSLLAVDAGGMLRLIDTATISELYVWSGQFTHGDIAWQQGKKRLVVWDNDRHLISIDLTDASRLDATPEDVVAVCGAKLLGMNSVRGRPFVREIDSDGTFAAPILRGREGEDVCTAPPVPWWETAAGAVFGWMFR